MSKRGKCEEPSDLQIQAGREWLNLKTRTRAERVTKVLAYLRANPNSTSEQVWDATDCSVDEVVQFTKRFRHHKANEHGRRPYVYSVDEAKVLRFFNSTRRLTK